jgi:hypothetical protein
MTELTPSDTAIFVTFLPLNVASGFKTSSLIKNLVKRQRIRPQRARTNRSALAANAPQMPTPSKAAAKRPRRGMRRGRQLPPQALTSGNVIPNQAAESPYNKYD